METITYAPALRGLIDLWRRADGPNDAAAQYVLAKILLKSGDPDTVKKAFALFKKLANQDYTPVQTQARYMLGVCYEDGCGIQKSYPRAIRWYKLAGDNIANDLRPLYKACEDKLSKELDAALDALDSRRFLPELVDCMIDAAEGGDLEAQKFLMDLYRYGDRDRGPDAAEAAYWTEKAAESGDVEAMDQLGRMLYYGQGMERDLRKGRDLMKMAAVRGSASSAYHLGRHYEKMKANKRAAEWYRLYASLEIRQRDRRLGRPVKREKTE